MTPYYPIDSSFAARPIIRPLLVTQTLESAQHFPKSIIYQRSIYRRQAHLTDILDELLVLNLLIPILVV